jgi:broad specificity phosphatase PhoE
MKVILLRHEDRELDMGFNSNLTDQGIYNTIKLSEKLKELNINHIYSSPFIRTLQTIYYYAFNYNNKVNVEYGLYEYLHNPYFLINPSIYDISNIKDEDLKSIINNDYISNIDINDFYVLENEIELQKRISIFFNYLIEKYKDTNDTILIVSHKGVINKIKSMYFKKTNMKDDFPMGHFEIYEL